MACITQGSAIGGPRAQSDTWRGNNWITNNIIFNVNIFLCILMLDLGLVWLDSTYICKTSLPKMTFLKNKYRSRLTDHLQNTAH